MNIDHVHFYVEDAAVWRDWFIRVLNFQPWTPDSHELLQDDQHCAHTQVVGVQSGEIRCKLSSAITDQSPVFEYLRLHPPGVVDVAFCVADLSAAIATAQQAGAKVLFQSSQMAQIAGWGVLRHTLLPDPFQDDFDGQPVASRLLQAIDHVVLNVEVGQLEGAIAFYEQTFGFQRQQAFQIRTDRSALCSQVLVHPQSGVKLPINQPGSSQSQIQEFLDHNRGAGVQHIALQTPNIVRAIAQLRQQGLSFLKVPATYYEQLRQRSGFQLLEGEWEAIARQQVLVDWPVDQAEAMLLQAFTQPIFEQPTFFFELIERRQYWQNNQYQSAQGFGEGNFQALFEAIEREQMKRGAI
ncbi:MAG: 4-hydroxyphenylpyruvate dioxygenase [Oculatellaceae cyanobacterium Prado106]|jgi:4-hydroxyphenylpyruvate dioxygenase|nr:4-hydroxyphenylpyruvate dioxygenase [Oculatellaceae cyanobacterium Prado106]